MRNPFHDVSKNRRIVYYGICILLIIAIIVIVLFNTTDLFYRMDISNIYQTPKWGATIPDVEEILVEEEIGYRIEEFGDVKDVVFDQMIDGRLVECNYFFSHDMQIGSSYGFLDTDRLVMVQYYIYDVSGDFQIDYYDGTIGQYGQPIESNFLVSEYQEEPRYAFWDLDEASINLGQVDLAEGKDVLYLHYNVSPVGREAFKQYITDVTLY